MSKDKTELGNESSIALLSNVIVRTVRLLLQIDIQIGEKFVLPPSKTLNINEVDRVQLIILP